MCCSVVGCLLTPLIYVAIASLYLYCCCSLGHRHLNSHCDRANIETTLIDTLSWYWRYFLARLWFGIGCEPLHNGFVMKLGSSCGQRLWNVYQKPFLLLLLRRFSTTNHGPASWMATFPRNCALKTHKFKVRYFSIELLLPDNLQ